MAQTQREWKYRLWGTRGSVSVSGFDKIRYGGLTTCVEIDLPDGRILIDAGTGLAEFGRRVTLDKKPTLLLLTHFHWDHLVGFPLFQHIYMPGWDLDIRGVRRNQVSVFDPFFPDHVQANVQARLTHSDLEEAGSLDFHGAKLTWIPVHHPQGCSAFAIEIGDQKIVFMTDIELPFEDRDRLAKFCENADLLICDAQYTEEEYASHRGWGHSTNKQAAQFALEAKVGRLILTHHDPSHDDNFIDGMVEEAQKIFPNTSGARDRMIVASGKI